MQNTNEVKRDASNFATSADASDQSEMVVAKVPQGYETNINVRLVPGGDVEITPSPKVCRPREGALRRDAEPLALPPDLIEKLKKADKAVVAWLAQDEANAAQFIARPAEALVKAGVDLTRADQKAIDRARSEVGEATVVGPGVKVASFTAVAFPGGRIGKIKPGAKPQDKPNNIACVKED